MEERLNYITVEFQRWLSSILLSKKVDIFILYELRDENILLPPFEVQITPRNNARYSPIEKVQGYLITKGISDHEVCKELLTIGKDTIKFKRYTPSGLANFLILIDRLGSIPDSKQHEMIKAICEMIPLKSYKLMLNALIDEFNGVYKLNKRKGILQSISYWEDLFFSIQYLDHFDNPIGLLAGVIHYRSADTDILAVLSKLDADPRAALLEYQVDLSEIKEVTLLSLLKEKPSECAFWSAVIFEESSNKPSFLGKKLVAYLIDEKWDEIGKFIFRKVYINTKRDLNTDTRSIFCQHFDSFLSKQLVRDFNTPTIISKFSWNEDFLALGGWLMEFQEEHKEVSWNKQFPRDLAGSFAQRISAIKTSLPGYISEKENMSSIWFLDTFDIKSQYILSYITWALLLCEEDIWEKVIREFKKLLFELKLLFYGSYTSVRLAKEIANHMLTLLLSYPGFDKDVSKEKRLWELFQAFEDIIGMQWVYFVEREKIVWGNSKYEPSFGEGEILYILKRLKDVPKEYTSVIEKFNKMIDRNSTTLWPI